MPPRSSQGSNFNGCWPKPTSTHSKAHSPTRFCSVVCKDSVYGTFFSLEATSKSMNRLAAGRTEPADSRSLPHGSRGSRALASAETEVTKAPRSRWCLSYVTKSLTLLPHPGFTQAIRAPQDATSKGTLPTVEPNLIPHGQADERPGKSWALGHRKGGQPTSSHTQDATQASR